MRSFTSSKHIIKIHHLREKMRHMSVPTCSCWWGWIGLWSDSTCQGYSWHRHWSWSASGRSWMFRQGRGSLCLTGSRQDSSIPRDRACRCNPWSSPSSSILQEKLYVISHAANYKSNNRYISTHMHHLLWRNITVDTPLLQCTKKREDTMCMHR